MARTINTAVHLFRRDAFVDAAQRLIQTRGFDEMSIQDVLDELDASRGAFYHYFDSKVGLLEAVVERMVIGAMASLEPLLADPHLSALDKLVRLFAGIRDFKSERKELLLGFTRVWMSDENALVRDKLRRLMDARLAPLLVSIVRQGQVEGTFTVTAPEATASVLVSLWQGLSERASELYLARQTDAISLEEVEHILSAYLEAFERILGLPYGSLPREQGTVREWFGEAATHHSPE